MSINERKFWWCMIVGHKIEHRRGTINWQYHDRFHGTGDWHCEQKDAEYTVCLRCDATLDTPPIPPMSQFIKDELKNATTE